jgi:hypothetical protein
MVLTCCPCPFTSSVATVDEETASIPGYGISAALAFQTVPQLLLSRFTFRKTCWPSASWMFTIRATAVRVGSTAPQKCSSIHKHVVAFESLAQTETPRHPYMLLQRPCLHMAPFVNTRGPISGPTPAVATPPMPDLCVCVPCVESLDDQLA